MLQTKSLCIILALVLFVTLAEAGGRSRRRSGSRSSRQSYRPDYKLQTLKAQIRACRGKFVCDVVTSGGICMPVCIDGKKVCDGDRDCDNGVDEPNDCPTPAPTTAAPTTAAPTTEAPTTEAPTTEAPTTEAPTTEAPTTEGPTTKATAPPPVPCPALQFRCVDGGTCNDISLVCDTNNDCKDAGTDDEASCELNCDLNLVKCKNAADEPICAPICDGNEDCDNGFDEPFENCDCTLDTATESFCLSADPAVAADIIETFTVPLAECAALCRDEPTCNSIVHDGTTCLLTVLEDEPAFGAVVTACTGNPNQRRVFLCV